MTETTTRQKWLVLRTTSTIPDYRGDCDYGVVELSPRLVESLKAKARDANELCRKHPDLWECHFWDSPCQMVCCDESLCDIVDGEEFNGQGWQIVEGLELADDAYQRTECNQTIIRTVRPGEHSDQAEIEIAFVAVPKHTDMDVMTEGVPLVRLIESVEGR